MKKPTPKKPTGRPTLYEPAIADAIVEAVGNGDPTTKACKERGIHLTTFWSWLKLHPDLDESYARARETRAEKLADELVAIADEARDKEDAPAVKLRLEARQWVAQRMSPRRWGDRQNVELTGKDGGPIQHDLAGDLARLRAARSDKIRTERGADEPKPSGDNAK